MVLVPMGTLTQRGTMTGQFISNVFLQHNTVETWKSDATSKRHVKNKA